MVYKDDRRGQHGSGFHCADHKHAKVAVRTADSNGFSSDGETVR